MHHRGGGATGVITGSRFLPWSQVVNFGLAMKVKRGFKSLTGVEVVSPTLWCSGNKNLDVLVDTFPTTGLRAKGFIFTHSKAEQREEGTHGYPACARVPIILCAPLVDINPAAEPKRRRLQEPSDKVCKIICENLTCGFWFSSRPEMRKKRS